MPRASTYMPLAAGFWSPSQSQVLTELAEQAVKRHRLRPSSKGGTIRRQVHYQNEATSPPFIIARQSQSRARLEQLATALAAASEDESRQLLIGAFCTEIGAPENLAHNGVEGVEQRSVPSCFCP